MKVYWVVNDNSQLALKVLSHQVNIVYIIEVIYDMVSLNNDFLFPIEAKKTSVMV